MGYELLDTLHGREALEGNLAVGLLSAYVPRLLNVVLVVVKVGGRSGRIQRKPDISQPEGPMLHLTYFRRLQHARKLKGLILIGAGM